MLDLISNRGKFIIYADLIINVLNFLGLLFSSNSGQMQDSHVKFDLNIVDNNPKLKGENIVDKDDISSKNDKENLYQ
jgi:hypothetical protein